MSDDDFWAEGLDPHSSHNLRESGKMGGMFEIVEGEKRSLDLDPDRNERATRERAQEVVTKHCYVLNRDGLTCEYFYSTPFHVIIYLLASEPFGTVNCASNDDTQAVFQTNRDPVVWPHLYKEIEEVLNVTGQVCRACGLVISADDEQQSTEDGAFHAKCWRGE